MEPFPALLAPCAGNSPVTGEFPSQRPVTRSFGVFCAWTNGWVNNRDVGDMKRHHAHYDVIVMWVSVVSPMERCGPRNRVYNVKTRWSRVTDICVSITLTSWWAWWRLKSPASWLVTHSLFRRRSKKTPKLRVTGLCEWNSPLTGEFPWQRTSNAENVFFWWRHHEWTGHHDSGSG